MKIKSCSRAWTAIGISPSKVDEPDPNTKPQESKGTATRKSAMGGRHAVMDVTGKMQMPGEDGKMKDMQIKGMGIKATTT